MEKDCFEYQCVTSTDQALKKKKYTYRMNAGQTKQQITLTIVLGLTEEKTGPKL